MKKRDFIKKSIEDNVADKEAILINTLNSTSTEKSFEGIRPYKYRRAAFRFTAVSLVTALAVYLNFGSIHSSHLPDNKGKISVDNNENNLSQNTPLQKNSFTVFACVIDNNTTTNTSVPGIDASKKNQLKIDSTSIIPYGKINRGKLTNYVSEKGVPYKAYEVIYDSSWGLICSGEKIKSVTYTSVNGILHYFDVDLLKDMERNGQLYICKIPITELEVKPDWGYEKVKKAFNEKWSSGKLDSYKNQYFNGQNINLDDYSISISGANDGTNNKYMKIAKKEMAKPPYIQNGTTVKVSGESQRPVNWLPENSMNTLREVNTNISYENLPSDSITVKAEFEDGEIITKTLNLSFDVNGNLIMEVNK
jgi:hypothetical protein